MSPPVVSVALTRPSLYVSVALSLPLSLSLSLSRPSSLFIFLLFPAFSLSFGVPLFVFASVRPSSVLWLRRADEAEEAGEVAKGSRRSPPLMIAILPAPHFKTLVLCAWLSISVALVSVFRGFFAG